MTNQHFSGSHLTNYIFREIDIKSNEKIYEPYLGGGSFLIKVLNYVYEKKGDKKAESFKSNVYGNECESEILRFLKLNLLIEFKTNIRSNSSCYL